MSAAPRCVVVGYDGSPEGTGALRWALENAAVDGVVLAVAVLGSEPAPLPGGARLAHVTTRMAHHDQRLWQAWSVDAKAVGEEAELLVEHGLPAEVLLRVASERGADVIVVGHHRRRLQAVLPSVLRDLLRDATIPVVIVP